MASMKPVKVSMDSLMISLSRSCRSLYFLICAEVIAKMMSAISQIAIWRRALSKDEIAMAFGYPRAVFGAGTADGSAGEFATACGSGSAEGSCAMQTAARAAAQIGVISFFIVDVPF